MTNVKSLKKTFSLAKKVGFVFMATAGAKGLPHVAAAAKISQTADIERVAVEAWFCPETVANLQTNCFVALIIWDPKSDHGYQLLGETEKIEETALLNGYLPRVEDKSSLPQVERRLLIRVDKVLKFSQAPHTDEEE